MQQLTPHIPIYSASTLKFSFSLGLARFHLAKMDPRLFSLVVELRDTNPRQEGLTSKAVRLISRTNL